MAGGIKQGCMLMQQPMTCQHVPCLLFVTVHFNTLHGRSPSLLQFGMAHKGTSVVLYRTAEIRCGCPAAPLTWLDGPGSEPC